MIKEAIVTVSQSSLRRPRCPQTRLSQSTTWSGQNKRMKLDEATRIHIVNQHTNTSSHTAQGPQWQQVSFAPTHRHRSPVKLIHLVAVKLSRNTFRPTTRPTSAPHNSMPSSTEPSRTLSTRVNFSSQRVCCRRPRFRTKTDFNLRYIRSRQASQEGGHQDREEACC
jgi:hypothetical protein